MIFSCVALKAPFVHLTQILELILRILPDVWAGVMTDILEWSCHDTALQWLIIKTFGESGIECQNLADVLGLAHNRNSCSTHRHMAQ